MLQMEGENNEMFDKSKLDYTEANKYINDVTISFFGVFSFFIYYLVRFFKPELEMRWAVKAYQHAETYFNVSSEMFWFLWNVFFCSLFLVYWIQSFCQHLTQNSWDSLSKTTISMPYFVLHSRTWRSMFLTLTWSNLTNPKRLVIVLC